MDELRNPDKNNNDVLQTKPKRKFFDVDIDIRVRRIWTHNVRHTLGHGIADSNSDTDSDFEHFGIDDDVRYC